MDRLAGELCRRGALDLFVSRYVNKGRTWEQVLLALPGVRQRSAATVGRRPLSPGLSTDKVKDVGVAYDFLAALLLRARMDRFSTAGWSWMLRRRNSAIAREGAELLGNARTVVGNYGVAAATFEKVRSRGGRTILNYPNVHHRYSRKLLAEEAERQPQFACTLTHETSVLAPVFDRECELSDTILVGSSFVRHSFVEEGVSGKDIRVIPYGSDTARFHPSDSSEGDNVFRILFVGQLTLRKGICYLLQAYQAFRGPGTELRIVGRFVGDPNAFSSHRSLFTYLGNVSYTELPKAFRSADVFVFPTILDGMGLAVLEAMASGLPVITTANGPGDIVRDGVDGFIVPIRDPDAITQRLEYLRANPEVRVEMGRSARKRALEFTWNAYCNAAAAVVLECGKSHSSASDVDVF